MPLRPPPPACRPQTAPKKKATKKVAPAKKKVAPVAAPAAAVVAAPAAAPAPAVSPPALRRPRGCALLASLTPRAPGSCILFPQCLHCPRAR